MKLRELAELPVDQLQIKLTEMQNDLAELRFGRASQPLDNPLRLRILRRDIAKAMTLLKEYEVGRRIAPAVKS